ncbi:MAG: type II toxin-antitoxin system VapB family antitoxin [Bryobacteraceae bacterium]|jgi:antitoxin VapB
MPVLNIKDPEVHALALELAQHTGETLTQAAEGALRDRLARERAAKSDRRRLIARVLELGRRASSRPVLDPRSPEEILGYDEFGAPRS